MDSSGRRNDDDSGSNALREDAGGGSPAERVAGPVILAVLDLAEDFVAVDRDITALGGVSAEEPVGVLVRPALPGATGIAEVDALCEELGYLLMPRHFAALVPREWEASVARDRQRHFVRPS